MKIKDTYVLRNVAGENLIVPIGGDNLNFNTAMTLNETGAFLWNILLDDVTVDTLIDKMMGEYAVDRETAQKDINIFLNKLREQSILDE